MSAGNFTRSFYTTDAGAVASIRIQPETLTLSLDGGTNLSPGGPATLPISARVSGSNRGIGLKARTVRFRFTGAVPEGYATNGILTLPVLSQTFYNAINAGDTGTYLGSAVEVVGKSPERVR